MSGLQGNADAPGSADIQALQEYSIVRLTPRHVLEECMAVEACRIREGIRTFLAQCRMAGLSHASAYLYYIQGKSAGGSKIPRREHLQRGASLIRLTEVWKDTWLDVL